MDFKIHGEAPQFKRCCFCLPLRRGLLGWGYARLVLDILVIIYLIILVFMLLAYHASFEILKSFVAAVAFFTTDVGFTVLLIFAGHKKNSKLLRISYIYSTAWVILVLALSVFGLISDVNRLYETWQFSHRFLVIELVMSCAIVFTVVFVQIYVILLTRSEAIKLQNQSLEMQFVNNAAEGEARCVPATHRGADDGHTPVQCTDDGHTPVPCTDDRHTAVQYMDDGHTPVPCTDDRHTAVQYTDDGHTPVQCTDDRHDASV